MKKKETEKRGRLRRFFYPGSVIAVTGVCAYVLVPGFREVESVRARLAELERVRVEKRSSNEVLKKEIAGMQTAEGIELAARRHLRLAKPEEVIVVFESPREETSTER